jgi:hypothetical protein
MQIGGQVAATFTLHQLPDMPAPRLLPVGLRLLFISATTCGDICHAADAPLTGEKVAQVNAADPSLASMLLSLAGFCLLLRRRR